MRQIGDDMKFDPKDVIVMQPTPMADMSNASN